MLASIHEVFFLFSLLPIVFTYLMEQEKTQFHSDCFIKSHSYQQSSEMTTIQWLDWYFEGLIISTGYMYIYLPVLNGEKTQYCSEAGKWGYLFGLKDSRLNLASASRQLYDPAIHWGYLTGDFELHFFRLFFLSFTSLCSKCA